VDRTWKTAVINTENGFWHRDEPVVHQIEYRVSSNHHWIDNIMLLRLFSFLSLHHKSVWWLLFMSVTTLFTTIAEAARFYYLSPDNSTDLQFCIAPKVGSTSFMNALYKSIYHQDFTPTPIENDKGKLLTYVQGWEFWPPPQNAPMSEFPHLDTKVASRINVWAIRDPIDRYLSVFYSKVACCPTHDLDGERKACHHDTDVVSLGGKSCLYFGEYVNLLARAKEAGQEGKLNAHFQPQRLYCPQQVSPNTTNMMGKVSEVFAIFKSLPQFHFQNMKEVHLHASPRPAAAKYPDKDMSILCNVAYGDYIAMKLEMSHYCK
jgi:hypothetical protein